MKGQTETDLADRLAHETWAAHMFLNSIGYGNDVLTVNLGHPMRDNAVIERDRRVVTVLMRASDNANALRQVSLTIGPLTMSPELFEQAWIRWVRSIQPDPKATPKQVLEKEMLLKTLYETSEIYNQRAGIYQYLVHQGIRIPLPLPA
jgi:hypothetical protein